VNSKRLLCLASMMLLLFGTAGMVWAYGDASYNRPNPLMDYAPQELGIYDGVYGYSTTVPSDPYAENLTESDCRLCHGVSVADRHHGTIHVVRDGECSSCHPTVEDPPGVTINRDCVTDVGEYGCHSWDNAHDYTDPNHNGWHHTTDEAASGQCTTCHDQAYLDPIEEARDFNQYPPTVVTPTPFSCENCHWKQTVMAATGDPMVDDANAGHPSTYDHYNRWKAPIGYFEYGKQIWQNFETHHMDSDWPPKVADDCFRCHRGDPLIDGLDEDDPEIIRWCERCHRGYYNGSLHRIRAHLGMVDSAVGTPPEYFWEWQGMGWEATGFHAVGTGDRPDTYRDFEADGSDDSTPSEPYDGMCWGCHGDAVEPYTDDLSTIVPNLTGMTPGGGCCGVYVTLTGSDFGDEHIDGRGVDAKSKLADLSAWRPWSEAVDLNIVSWSDTRIVAEVPCWIWYQPAAPGDATYGPLWLRVYTEGGSDVQITSGNAVFNYFDCSTPTSISVSSPPSGPCSAKITLSNPNGNYGAVLTETLGQNSYRTKVIDFVGSAGTFTAIYERDNDGTNPTGDDSFWGVDCWQQDTIKVKFENFYEDSGETLSARNFIRDTSTEPVIPGCANMPLGTYSVYIRYVYFNSVTPGVVGQLDANDFIYQVETSNSALFTLTNEPFLFRSVPTDPVAAIPGPFLKLVGANFGTLQEDWEIWIGNKAKMEDATINKNLGLGSKRLDFSGGNSTVKFWSMTKIRFRLNLGGSYSGTTKWIWLENPSTGETSANGVRIFIQ
jgi:hypothetical protein